MRLNTLNLSQPQNTFKGKFHFTGRNWTKQLQDHLIKNQELFKDLTENRDVFVRVSRRTSFKNNIYQSKGDKLYKVKFSSVKEGSKLGVLLDKLHLNRRVSLTNNYYTERALMGRVDELHADRVISLLS